MSNQEQITTQLAQFMPIFDEVRRMRSEWNGLQQAEQAQAEYQLQTAQLDSELINLNAKRKELEDAKRKLKVAADVGPGIFRPPPGGAKPIAAPGQSPAAPRERPDAAAGNQAAIQNARTQLQKLVGRWGWSWQLSADVQGRINRIADDPTRPLGEALALLEWVTFANPIGSSESEEQHLTRLAGWGAALVEYRDQLYGEIDMLKTKYRRIIPILEAWSARNTDEGRRSWDQQVAGTIAAKREEVEKVRQEILALIVEE